MPRLAPQDWAMLGIADLYTTPSPGAGVYGALPGTPGTPRGNYPPRTPRGTPGEPLVGARDTTQGTPIVAEGL